VLAHKIAILRDHCAVVGRDIAEIEFTLRVQLTLRDSAAEAEQVWRAAMAHNGTPPSGVPEGFAQWAGTPEAIADRLRPFIDLGFRTIISEQPAPYDVETLERFIGEVAPLLDRA
jgi:alkanesulfonate monooxygenase SsuD/methylene tetrahydromethanopterin reductase-like flavin-dependent oxidoreductase (luciferase family)